MCSQNFGKVSDYHLNNEEIGSNFNNPHIGYRWTEGDRNEICEVDKFGKFLIRNDNQENLF